MISDYWEDLTTAQRQQAYIIEREMQAEGIHPDIIAAALVNAHAESGFDPNAVGDKGNSVGLFQLNIKGAGAGMTVEQRKDPVQNTKRIIEVYRKVQSRVDAGIGDIAKATELWCIHVEIPSNKYAKGLVRAAIAKQTYPVKSIPIGSLPTPTTTIVASHSYQRSKIPWVFAITVSGAALLLWWHSRTRRTNG